MKEKGSKTKKRSRAAAKGDSIGEKTPDILSEELREELGLQDEDDIVMVGKKPKKEKVENVPAELIAKAKKMTKSQRKRFESYQRRQENEKRQREYIATLEKHSISDQERRLLLSGKDVGQTHTTKQLLQMTLKRYRAGLKLTEEEHDLLFPRTDSGAFHSHLPKVEQDCDVVTVDPSDSGPASVAAQEEVSLGLSIFGASSDAATPSMVGSTLGKVADGAKSSNKKRKKEKKKTGTAGDAAGTEGSLGNELVRDKGVVHLPSASIAQSNPPLASGLGASLMDQLAAMKASGRLAQKEKEEDKEEDGCVNRDMEESGDGNDHGDDNSAPTLVYQAAPLVIPAMTGMELGEQSRTAPKSQERDCTDTAAERSSTVRAREILLNRSDSIQEARLQLPVCKMEQEIVEAITYNDAVIVCGETGSGKSTQIPQFLYEYGYSSGVNSKAGGGMIGITQPRRVAAVSTAKRVAVEMGCPIDDDNIDATHEESVESKKGRKGKGRVPHSKRDGGLVGYQIRHDASTVKAGKTAIKFMTDGILLREITTDLLLPQYSVLILDEAHERNVNTDMLLGLLSRAVVARRRRAEQEQARWMTLSEQEKEEYTPPIQPLKLVIMSATLRVSDFLNDRLFPASKPPVIKVEARQYEVHTHFAKRTELHHYLKEAHRKAMQIHTKLPPGGILVFLTGKREIQTFCAKLRKSLAKRARGLEGQAATESKEGTGVSESELEPQGRQRDDDDEEGEDWHVQGQDLDSYSDYSSEEDKEEEEGDDRTGADGEDATEISLITRLHQQEQEALQRQRGETREMSEGEKVREQMLKRALGQGNAQVETDVSASAIDTATTDQASMSAGKEKEEEEEEEEEEKEEEEKEAVQMKARVLPLHAMLPSALQARVFAPCPDDTRLIVVATNVAETSITIPGIRYVVDCGRTKTKTVDPTTGISQFSIQWISKASAEQRKGRAGRTGPGHVYRLYSSAFYHNYLPQFSPPEILITSLEELVLQMKAMGIGQVKSFPFPTPPPPSALRAAVTLLENLGAVSRGAMTSTSSRGNATMRWLMQEGDANFPESTLDPAITSLGGLLASFSLSPRYAKMIVVAHAASMKGQGLVEGSHRNRSDSPLPLLSMTLSMIAMLGDKSPFVTMADHGGDVGKMGKENKGDNSSDESSGDEKEQEDAEGASKHTALWSHPQGDPIARLRALGALCYALHTRCGGGGEGKDKERGRALSTFCAQNRLNPVVMTNALELRAQLQRQCEKIYGVNSKSKAPLDNNSGPTSKDRILQESIAAVATSDLPTETDLVALRQVLLVGSVDCVAKRLPPGVITEGSRRRRLTAYSCCHAAVASHLYIHPTSALYSSDPTAPLPEYVLFSSLTRSESGDTVYMNSVTPISPKWLSSVLKPADGSGSCPLLRYGRPLESPSPYYDAQIDQIVCYCVPVYGVHKWTLSPEVIPLEQALCGTREDEEESIEGTKGVIWGEDAVYRWFARTLLEGYVIESDVLDRDCTYLKEPAAVMTSTRPSARASALLLALKKNRVKSRASLMAALSESKQRYDQVSSSQADAESHRLWLCDEVSNFIKASARKRWRESYRKILSAL